MLFPSQEGLGVGFSLIFLISPTPHSLLRRLRLLHRLRSWRFRLGFRNRRGFATDFLDGTGGFSGSSGREGFSKATTGATTAAAFEWWSAFLG
jgi:hypothetical protein